MSARRRIRRNEESMSCMPLVCLRSMPGIKGGLLQGIKTTNVMRYIYQIEFEHNEMVGNSAIIGATFTTAERAVLLLYENDFRPIPGGDRWSNGLTEAWVTRHLVNPSLMLGKENIELR